MVTRALVMMAVLLGLGASGCALVFEVVDRPDDGAVDGGEVIHDSDLGTGCLRAGPGAPSCPSGETAVECSGADPASRIPDVCTPNGEQWGFCCPLAP